MCQCLWSSWKPSPGALLWKHTHTHCWRLWPRFLLCAIRRYPSLSERDLRGANMKKYTQGFINPPRHCKEGYAAEAKIALRIFIGAGELFLDGDPKTPVPNFHTRGGGGLACCCRCVVAIKIIIIITPRRRQSGGGKSKTDFACALRERRVCVFAMGVDAAAASAVIGVVAVVDVVAVRGFFAAAAFGISCFFFPREPSERGPILRFWTKRGQEKGGIFVTGAAPYLSGGSV